MFLCFTFLKTLNIFVPILNYILLPRFSIWFWLVKLPVFVLYQEKKPESLDYASVLLSSLILQLPLFKLKTNTHT